MTIQGVTAKLDQKDLESYRAPYLEEFEISGKIDPVNFVIQEERLKFDYSDDEQNNYLTES